MSLNPPSVDIEEDKSYVFLLYPPGYENSINPDHILARYNTIVNVLKFSNTFLFLLSTKMLVIKARICKMLFRLSNREDPYQTAYYSKCSKILNTFLFLLSAKMLFIKARIPQNAFQNGKQGRP